MFFFFYFFLKKYQSTIIILTLKNINSYVPSLEEECESSLCTAALRAMNMNLQNDMKKLTAIFEKLHTYISLLALPSKCGLWATTIQDSVWCMKCDFFKKKDRFWIHSLNWPKEAGLYICIFHCNNSRNRWRKIIEINPMKCFALFKIGLI